MQTGGAVQGMKTIRRHRWPNVLRVLVVITLVAGAIVLMVWVVPPTTEGTDAENVAPAADSAVVHDDAGNENFVRQWRPPSAIIHDDAGNVHTGLAPGYAPVHDDAGNVHPGAGSAIIHDDAGNVNR